MTHQEHIDHLNTMLGTRHRPHYAEAWREGYAAGRRDRLSAFLFTLTLGVCLGAAGVLGFVMIWGA